MDWLTEKIFGNSRFISISKEIVKNNHTYFQTLMKLRELENSNEKAIRTYHYEQLKKIIHYAALHVPYYKETFRQHGFRPETFQELEDIKHIPFLTKAIIRDNQDKLISRAVPGKYLKPALTGGSSGLPMNFYLDRRSASPDEFAYSQYIWRRIGYRFRNRCIVLRSDVVDKIVEGKSYWKRNLPMNWLLMSSFRLNEDTFPHYMKKILDFKPAFIIAYPSMAYVLGRLMKQNNIPSIPSLKGIICSSETLYEWQRKFIQDTFNVRILSYYGHSEKCCLAAECYNSGNYEFIPSYGYTEIINRSGNWCTQEDEIGEIVGTSLNNFVFPFIRYKTQDYCTFSADPCTHHPGWLSVKEIKGRISEFLINSKGEPVTFTCSDEVIMPVKHILNAYQYFQKIPGQVEIHFELKENPDPEKWDEMRRIFSRYYPGFDVTFKTVDNIPRTISGKFRFLIQQLPIEFASK